MTLHAVTGFFSDFGLIILSILALVVISGFFSGSETALTAVSRARMHALEANGEARAGVVARLIDTRDRLIGALLIGNNLANILASSLTTTLFLKLFGASGVAIATLAMTVVLVIFAEVLPKSWAISSPDRFSLAVSRSVQGVPRCRRSGLGRRQLDRAQDPRPVRRDADRRFHAHGA